jgi:hypothetical protein
MGSARSWDLPSRWASSGCSQGSSPGWSLSTFALEGSRPGGEGDRLGLVLRYGDLALLAVALPVFVIAELPMLGYAAVAAAWLAQHGIELAAHRRARESLAARDRRAAVGLLAGATLARVWLVALAILLVGGLGEREDGLAAAVLAAVLVTAHLGGQFLGRLAAPREDRP